MGLVRVAVDVYENRWEMARVPPLRSRGVRRGHSRSMFCGCVCCIA